jgi:naphthoate synthase
MTKVGSRSMTDPSTGPSVSEIFDPTAWAVVPGFEDLTDITYHRAVDLGAVRIAFNRPEVRNAFRPATVDELYRALDHARQSSDVGCVLLTGNGPSPRDGGWAFCSGGDQRIRGRDGYRYADGDTADTIDPARSGRLHILEVQRLIRTMPKVVICLVNGVGGGRRALACTWSADLTLASREHARFKSDRCGRGQLRRRLRLGLPGPPGRPEVRPRDLLPGRRPTRADDAHRMGMVNAVVDHAELEAVGPGNGRARVMGKSPYGAAHAEVLVQPDRRRPGGPAGVRGRGHPAGLHAPTRPPRAATRSWRSASRTGRPSPGTTDRLAAR